MSSDTTTIEQKSLEQKSLEQKSLELFKAIFASLEKDIGRENLRFPKEIMWLGGAPGAGKGTNTPLIMKLRGMTAEPVVMSSLLQTPEMRKIIDSGQLVGDKEVIEILLRNLLNPEYDSGVIVDGFPRTDVQCGVVKLLFEEMKKLRQEFFDTANGDLFREPIFRVTVLYVNEETSVERQLSRGRKAEEHNKKVKETGKGELIELRATDTSVDHVTNRYRVFVDQTYDALQQLQDSFLYHFIDASGSIASVEQHILKEFEYKSADELGTNALQTIENIPLPCCITKHARQELVRRLDTYADRENELFTQIAALIERKFVPAIRRHALSGRAVVRVSDSSLASDIAVDMIIDILSERGYRVTAIPGSSGGWSYEISFEAPSIR